MPLADMSQSDIEYAKQFLSYDPDTGIFTWRITRRQMPAGSVAGSVNSRGYRCISIRNRIRRAARVAWMLSYGVWPMFEVDHKNGNRDDNRLANLRPSNRYENVQNRGNFKRPNLTGFRGVTFKPHVPGKAYEVTVGANGGRVWVGSYYTAEEAAEAYKAAARKLHGEFYWEDNWT